MIKDMIRVGPSQGTIDGLDLGALKEFDKDFHKDFRKELQLAKDKDAKENRVEAKVEKQEKPNRDTDQVSKKSSGGTKRKMAKSKDEESDDRETKTGIPTEAKISNIMVSNEGEVEIADNEENLPQIATDENIQNSKIQLLAQLGANGEAMSADEQSALGEALPQDQAQQFQHLTSAEQALLADINGQAELQASNAAANADMSAEATELQLQQDIEGLDVAAQMPQQDAQASGVHKTTALENKAFDILNKENATAAGVAQKIMQQDASQSSEQQKGDSQQKGSDSQSQALPKFDASNDLAAQVQALHTGQRSFQSHLGAAGAAGAAGKAEANTDAMKDENIREIMNQAKILVTKGGGEMTVKMTPEGMGEVQLKVALQDGKINIEMNSQDKSVKKMIEESLSDLKSSLASHQMRVEHVKINNVTAVDTNNQSQFQSDANSSNSSFQNRQQQETNFQNMANSNSGRGGQHQERGQSSSYQTVQAPTVKPVAKANAYAAANKGSSINMVA